MHLGDMATKEKEIQVQGKVSVDARRHTMALHAGALSTSHPGRFTPGKSDDTSYIRGWVHPGANLGLGRLGSCLGRYI